MDRENMDKLGVVGNKLGEFKIEYEKISRAIILSAKKFLWEFADNTQRCVWRNKKENPEYNLRMFEQMYNDK